MKFKLDKILMAKDGFAIDVMGESVPLMELKTYVLALHDSTSFRSRFGTATCQWYSRFCSLDWQQLSR